jgi:hypothetical protein
MANKRPIRSLARVAALLCCASMMLVPLAHRTLSASQVAEVRHVISGHVLDPHRLRPESAALLVRAHDGNSVGSKHVSIGKDGAFVTPPLSPGTYVLEITRARYPSPEFNSVIGQRIVRLGETDLSDVSIEVRRDTAITGHFVMESRNPEAKWPSHIVVNAILALDGMPMWHGVMADGAPGGKFVLRNAFGPRVVRCGYTLDHGVPWWPSKVTLDGVDITNVPTDFSKHEGGRLEVGFTQKPARIFGTVTDANGSPVRTPWIIVNAAERALWQRWATTSDVAQGDAQGRFSIVVIPGNYRIHAVPHRSFDTYQAARKAALRFATDGVPLSLQEHERKSVTLTVRREP